MHSFYAPTDSWHLYRGLLKKIRKMGRRSLIVQLDDQSQWGQYSKLWKGPATKLRAFVREGQCVVRKQQWGTENGRKSSSLNSKALDRDSLGALGLDSVHVVYNTRGKTTTIIGVPTTDSRPYMPSNKGLNVLRLSLLSSRLVSRVPSPSFHLSLQKTERNACIHSNTRP